MPMYQMNKKGFTLLAMGYTGKEAMKFKEAYIDEFEKMEKN
jgi:Rha family phage regulatory protein